ncbi:PIN/TRAM domain-containing protein [Mitsuokella sp. AF21-1AC]|uniref:PIN/TRAM domain-containing protein n=1 Tax=Mitsuokella sp. AF21-1AC TaxID=2292235 RepID=UPI000E52D978|nr:PIN/TRAM domain-containing protein [Mitsuokella sp. AF21-1AC]RGS70259.1 PIN/TRAM domain-containing protein [Mitsuokella sp. AF21-1AC]
MLDRVLRFFITLFLAIAGGALLDLASPLLTLYISTEILKMDMGAIKITMASLLCILLGAILGGLIGFFLSPYLIRRLKKFSIWVETQLGKMPIHDVIAGAIGLSIGLIIANLLGYSFAKIPVVGDYIPVIFSIVFGYLGIHVTIKKREELAGLFDFIPRFMKELSRAREAKNQADKTGGNQPVAGVPAGGKAPAADKLYKLLDTSVIIDGRIADICDTGFIEGTLLIPVFVLEELQHIADSADVLKRTRGRRGLDILQRIRQGTKVKVEITNVDFDDIAEVDSKLVRLGQQVGGKIITNDFNLNKVAQLRGVPVLNINELSNAVKPVVIPGETMRVTVVKSGKEPGQGVAYLDDGTMIVIENGHRHMNETIQVEVTSALQTAAGRMIFAKPAHV